MNQKGNILLPIIIITLIILGVFFWIGHKNFFPNTSTNTSYSQTSPSPYPSLIPDKMWHLIRTQSDGKKEEIAQFSQDPLVTKYQNTLFFGNTNDYHEPLIIKALDIPSGKVETVYTKTEEDQRIANSINNMQVIGNTLYFTTGGYRLQGSAYYFNLPLSQNPQPKKINDAPNQTIIKVGNNYLLYGGEGDSCGGESVLSYLDLSSKIVTKIVETKYLCGDGTTVLGYDNQNRALVLTQEKSDQASGSGASIGQATKIEAIETFPPFNKTDLIPTSLMPKAVLSVRISLDKNNIYLLTKTKLYNFEISSQKLSEIITVPDPEVNDVSSLLDVSEKKVCLSGEINIKVDLETKQLTPRSPECQGQGPAQDKVDIQKLFKDFNLPSNYSLTLE